MGGGVTGVTVKPEQWMKALGNLVKCGNLVM